jgi:hypothetical protein
LKGLSRAAAAASICMLLGSSFAAGAELPDGVYYCSISMMHLGDIEISGDSYRGPAFDGKYTAEYPFEVTDAGTINWGGPLGGISSDGNTVVSTTLKNAGGGKIGFDIVIQNSRGNFQTVSCAPW